LRRDVTSTRFLLLQSAVKQLNDASKLLLPVVTKVPALASFAEVGRQTRVIEDFECDDGMGFTGVSRFARTTIAHGLARPSLPARSP
jgi:hypothetical protein